MRYLPFSFVRFGRLLLIAATLFASRLIADTIIVDNLDAGFTYTPATSWAIASSPGGFSGTNYLFDPITTADTGLEARGTPTIAAEKAQNASKLAGYRGGVSGYSWPACFALAVTAEGGGTWEINILDARFADLAVLLLQGRR